MCIVGCYVSYLLISLTVIVWVARAVHKNGRVFLVGAFQGNAELADTVNHLSLAGLYLVNIGYVVLTLTTTENLATPRTAIEGVISKIGGGLLFLGATVFLDLFVGRHSFRASSGLDVPFVGPAPRT